jgi:hypothetical protein
MRRFIYISMILLVACGGTLTDEQRKKLKEGMKLNEIKKISEAQITEAAFAMGRSLAKSIDKANRKQIDSLQRTCKVKILSLHLGDSQLLKIEKEIVEAYTAGSGQVQLNDNVQRVGTDSLLYTKPIMKELQDGSLQFTYALGIRIPRKQVVLSIRD